MPRKILIVAGEPSGDLHASNLIREMKAVKADLEFFGMGGKLMREAGVRIIRDIEGLAFVGLSDVLKNLFTIKTAYKKILRETDEGTAPDLAILVDYPGFNLRLAKDLKKRGIPVAYYISPQVWAWAEERIDIIKDTVKKIVVFFKFEEELYKKHGVPAEFAGHPLVDTARASMTRDETAKKYGLDPARKTIALLPGSRRIEVARLLEVMLDSTKIISESFPGIKVFVSRVPGLEEGLYKKKIQRYSLDIKLITQDTYNILNASDLAIVASGTATLETALIGTPMVIIYKSSLLTWLAFKLVAKIKYIGLVNVLGGREAAPELVQFDANSAKIAAKAVELLQSPGKVLEMKKAFASIKSSLGPPGGYSRAAAAVLSCLK